MHAKSVQSCSILCDSMDRSPSYSSVLFSRQEYWSGLPCSPQVDLPDPAIKPVPPESLALAGKFFMTHATREALPLAYCTPISHTV